MKPRKQRGKTAFNPVDIHVGKRIKTLRKLRGMSQSSLGDSVGLAFQQIQKYEHGANRIGASRLFEFSQIFDVPVSYFFDDMDLEISGQPVPEAANLNIFNSPEATTLAHAYYRLPDQSVRNSFRNMIKAVADGGP
jgi:transcriptional regulator with XRE-family HTH domain